MDHIRGFFEKLQPSQSIPNKMGKSSVSRDKKTGFIQHNGKYYSLSIEGEEDKLKPGNKYYKKALKILQKGNYSELPSELTIVKGKIKSNYEVKTITLKEVDPKQEAPMKLERTTTFGRLARILGGGSKQISGEAEQKQSRSVSIQKSLTQLFGKDSPMDTNLLDVISSDKKIFKQCQDFIEVAGKSKKENLARLRKGLYLTPSVDLKEKKEALKTSLETLLTSARSDNLSQETIDSFIEKIMESTGGLTNTQPVKDLLTHLTSTHLEQNLSEKADLTRTTISREGLSPRENNLISLGFSQSRVEGQYTKFQVVTQPGMFKMGHFVISYASPEKDIIRQVTVLLDLTGLGNITADESSQIFNLLNKCLDKSPEEVEKWLKETNDDDVKQVKAFLSDKYSTFVAIASTFCKGVSREMGKAVFSLEHPEYELMAVTKKNIDQEVQKELDSRVDQLKEKGLDLSSHMQDLTLTEGGLKLKGNLNLSKRTYLTTFPEGLEVGGDLNLSNCIDLKSLPNNLKIGGNLILDNCLKLTSLPKGLEVGGDLQLFNCNKLSSLAEGLKVGRHIDFTSCSKLTEAGLQNPIQVGGNIRLIKTGLTSPPNWMTALNAKANSKKHVIYLGGTKISDSNLQGLRESSFEGVMFNTKKII